MSGVKNYQGISFGETSTVVAEYEASASAEHEFETEAQLEERLIALLAGQAYDRVDIRTTEQLRANLRVQLAKLNGYEFTDSEWKRLYSTHIAGANGGLHEKTERIQEDRVVDLVLDDGTSKSILLIDGYNIHRNSLQVMNQYVGDASTRTRYDVTILVNGLPLVHIELKRRNVTIRKAFQQINRYQDSSFWENEALFGYVQLFVISNGTYTKYYSNTVREQKVEAAKPHSRKINSDSFEFMSTWADGNNKPIHDLMDFAKTFLTKHTLLSVLTRYCVYNSERKLMVMRPYQITATERILKRVEISTNYKSTGTKGAGGYIWHTTGSGKTLTSFKTAQLATKMAGVDKVLFVVDRKDLDYQTMKEYNNYQEGAANSNSSTAVLKKQLEDDSRIIITTIQKLSTFIKANKGHEIFGGHIVIIFDECHRSQFGAMRKAITKAFKNYHIFGFTGTPILVENATQKSNDILQTTEELFGDRLHTYTIVDAIRDDNVLPFRISYHDTVKSNSESLEQIRSIDREEALAAPERIAEITRYILEHFDQHTIRNESYVLKDKRVNGFNALLATASITAAKRYYNAFSMQQEHLPPEQRLKVALIYSFAPDEAGSRGDAGQQGGFLAEESFDTSALDASSQIFLNDAIQDYNDYFNESFDAYSKFENYYKDLSLKLKNREVDLAIVVNMFLTGFDAQTMNTIFVDKNLQAHGLIQAFSRTNRILNSVKKFGNVVCFRALEQKTNDAIALFGNRDAIGTVVLEPYEHYRDEYLDKVAGLKAKFPSATDPMDSGEEAKKDFVVAFGEILKLRNILSTFDEFGVDFAPGGQLEHAGLSDYETQNYQSTYVEIYESAKKNRGGTDGPTDGVAATEKESILDELEFEIELIKQVDINIDYILGLVEQQAGESHAASDLRSKVRNAVDASPALRPKKDLIEEFVRSVNPSGGVPQQWQEFVSSKRDQEIDELIAEERLKPEDTRAFLRDSLERGSLSVEGMGISNLLPPMSRFGGKDAERRGDKKRRVQNRLLGLFERFFGA